jgi:xanthine dehydrogenase accessory factor
VNVYREIVDCIDAGRPFVTALVLSADGSTPAGIGARAVIGRSGGVCGTVGGGQVEGQAVRRAAEVCDAGRPLVLDFDLAGAAVEADAPICGGAMRLLLDPSAPEARAAYSAAADALQQRRRGALLTTLGHGEPPKVSVRWLAEGAVPDDLAFPGAEAVRGCLADEEPQLFADEARGVEVLVESVLPAPLLLIAGGGHIGQALARAAVLVGFEVTVVDDRPEFARASLFPDGVRTRCGPVGREVAACRPGPQTYVVIVTRGHASDAEALDACIRSPAAYLGMVGSRRKVAMMRHEFAESGRASEAELARLFAPIGLDIGALTVPEIAASIVAELISVRRRGPDAPPPGHMVRR